MSIEPRISKTKINIAKNITKLKSGSDRANVTKSIRNVLKNKTICTVTTTENHCNILIQKITQGAQLKDRRHQGLSLITTRKNFQMRDWKRGINAIFLTSKPQSFINSDLYHN